MRALAVVVALAAAGCFKPNLSDGMVVCGTSDECPSGQTCYAANHRCYAHLPAPGDDLAMPSGDDMAMGGAVDMTPPPPCSASNGTRLCADSTHAAVCMNNQIIVDRACPPTATCDPPTGHCIPPSPPVNCTAQKNCTGGLSCDVYVVGSNAFAGFCTPSVTGAAGGVNGMCSTVGVDDTSCRTGICAASDAAGTLRACLTPCNSGNDCGGGGISCSPVAVPTTIEGVSTSTLKFCIK